MAKATVKRASKKDIPAPTDYPLLRKYIAEHEFSKEAHALDMRALSYQVATWVEYIPLWEEFRRFDGHRMPPLPGSRFPARLNGSNDIIEVLSPFYIDETMDESFMTAWEPSDSYKEFLASR